MVKPIIGIHTHTKMEMSSQDLLTLVLYACLASMLFILIKRKTNSKPSKPKRLPPGPPKLPIIGNLHQLRNPLHRTLRTLSQKYGDLMHLQLGSVPTLVISSADMTREVINNFDTTFGGRASRYVSDMSTYGGISIGFSPYGEHWRELKKIAVLELLSMKRVQSFAAVRKDEVTLLIQSIVGSCPGPLDLTKLLHRLTNNVLCRVALGRTFYGDKGMMKTPQELLEELTSLSGTISLPDFFPRLAWLNKVTGFAARVKKVCKELDELYESAIKEHLDPNRAKSDHEDLVDVLLRLPRGTVLDKNVVKAVIADMFIAGTDTTASTLIWTMTELMRNPSAMKRAEEEVRGKVKGRNQVEESDLQDLTYIKAVVKETLRLHAPVPLTLPRETMAECEIKGYHVPAKTMVFINAQSMAMDEKSWNNPTEFRPERFLDSSIDFRGKHYEYIPFGVGRRICPGITFTSVVTTLVIANLLYCFDWELPKGMRPEDVDVEEADGITVNRKAPLYLVAHPITFRP